MRGRAKRFDVRINYSCYYYFPADFVFLFLFLLVGVSFLKGNFEVGGSETKVHFFFVLRNKQHIFIFLIFLVFSWHVCGDRDGR